MARPTGNKISLTALDPKLPETAAVSHIVGGETVELTVRRRLELREMLAFVDEVARTCVDLESGRYFPEIRAFSIRKNLVARYANVKLPTSLKRQYALLDDSGLPEAVRPHVDGAQLEEIERAIDDKIAFLLGTVLSTAQAAVTDVAKKLEAIAEQTGALFGQVDPEALGDLVEKLGAIAPEDAGRGQA